MPDIYKDMYIDLVFCGLRYHKAHNYLYWTAQNGDTGETTRYWNYSLFYRYFIGEER